MINIRGWRANFEMYRTYLTQMHILTPPTRQCSDRKTVDIRVSKMVDHCLRADYGRSCPIRIIDRFPSVRQSEVDICSPNSKSDLPKLLFKIGRFFVQSHRLTGCRHEYRESIKRSGRLHGK